MEERGSTFTDRWFAEVWNKGNAAVIDEMMDENVIIHGLGLDGSGIEPFKLFYKEFIDNFRDIHVAVDRVLTEGEYEAARCTASAVDIHTGMDVSFSGMVMVRIKDCKAIEVWNNFDFLSMYLQLGQKLV
jgi:predicted ester cyclase